MMKNERFPLMNERKKFSSTDFISKYGVIIALLLIVIVFSSLTPYFFSLKNFYAVGLTLSVIGLIAIGQTLCILIRGFDLSVGSVAAFAGILAALLTKNGLPYVIVFFIALSFGFFAGLINGVLIAKLKINALITTLGFLSIYHGLTYILSEGYSITVPDKTFSFLGTTHIKGVPLPIIILVIMFIVFFIILKFTKFGRYIYAIGGNPEAARISGINVDRIQILVYIICSMLAAFGGIILSSRLGAAQTTAGSSYNLDSIAAVVLGGTVLAGGKGNVLNSFIGVAIIGLLQNGLIMIHMPAYYQWVASGAVLIIAVLVQSIHTLRVRL